MSKTVFGLISGYAVVVASSIFVLSLLQIQASDEGAARSYIGALERQRMDDASYRRRMKEAAAEIATARQKFDAIEVDACFVPELQAASTGAVTKRPCGEAFVPAADALKRRGDLACSGDDSVIHAARLCQAAGLDREIGARAVALRALGDELAVVHANYEKWLLATIEQHPSLVGLAYLGEMPLLAPVVRAPSELLVLVLAILMGALGAIINLTRCFATPQLPDPPLRDYFYKPASAAVLAMAVYILFRAFGAVPTPEAGQLADLGKVASGGLASSLFFIALLGIVSGLCAKEAMEALERGARFVLGAKNGSFVYARGLAATVPAADLANACTTLQVAPPTWAAWLAEATPIPAETAQRIADVLGRPFRDLFSERSA